MGIHQLCRVIALFLSLVLIFSLVSSAVFAAGSLTTHGPLFRMQFDPEETEQYGSISGHVWESDGVTPIENAEITVKRDSFYSESTSTLSDGTYQFSGLLPGKYAIHASATGFVSEYYKDIPGYTTALPVVIEQTETIQDIDFTLEEGGCIYGHVYESDGFTPIEGAKVYANADNIGFKNYSALTLTDGSYLVNGLDPGEYQMTAYAPDYITGSAKNVKVGISSPVLVEFALIRGGSISGRIMDADAMPLTGVTVTIYSEDHKRGGSAKTDVDGKYQVNRLYPGIYTVQTSSDEYLGDFMGNVVVADQQNTSGIDIIVIRGGTISGHVSAVDPSSVSVMAQMIGQKSSSSGARAQLDGSYVIKGLQAGQYIVRAGSQEVLPQYYYDSTNIEEALLVTAGPGCDVTNIDFHLDPGASISGCVTDSSGAPLKATVAVEGVISRSVSTDSDGMYTVKGLSPGSYKVYAARSGYVSKYYHDAWYEEDATSIEVTSSENIQNIDFTLKEGGSISGYVYGPDGKSFIVHDYTIYVRPVISGKRPPLQTTSISLLPRGYYSKDSLPPGDYIVHAYSKTYRDEYYPGTAFSYNATPVTVTLGEKTENVNFILELLPEAGDLNLDNQVNIGDLVKLKRILLKLDSPVEGCDINQDGNVNVGDLAALLKLILAVYSK